MKSAAATQVARIRDSHGMSSFNLDVCICYLGRLHIKVFKSDLNRETVFDDYITRKYNSL